MERKDLLIELGNGLLPKKERKRRPRKRYNKSAKRKKVAIRKKQERNELRIIKTEIAEYQRNGHRVFSSNTIKKENEEQQENPISIIPEPSKKTGKRVLLKFSLFFLEMVKKILN